MSKRPLAVFLLCAFIALSSPPASALSSTESCFVAAIARERSSAGRRSLTVKSDLASIARRHSERMARDGRIYHSSNLGGGVSGSWTRIGENVGRGPACSSIHRAFMNSSSHRAIILGRDFNQVGVGVVVRSDVIYVTELFVARAGATVRRVAPRVSRTRRVAPPRPAPKPPKPVAPVPTAEPLNVVMLLSLVGLDVERVNPTTGRAMGI